MGYAEALPGKQGSCSSCAVHFFQKSGGGGGGGQAWDVALESKACVEEAECLSCR